MAGVVLKRVVSNEGLSIALAVVNRYAGLLVPKTNDGTRFYSITAADLGEPVGVIGYRPINKHIVEQVNTVILPDFRGRGYGQAASVAMTELLFAKGFGKVFCTVNTQNEPMLRIKKALGWDLEGNLKSHYAPGRDIFIFSRHRATTRLTKAG